MAGRDPGLTMEIDFDPYQQSDFDALLQAWLPLTYAVNSLNHSMGQPDLYPFVLAPAVIGQAALRPRPDIPKRRLKPAASKLRRRCLK